MATKRNHKGGRKGLRMSDSMKAKYAELFIEALNSMEQHNYKQPWVAATVGAPCNLYRKGKPYRKSNYFWLSMLISVRGWNTPYFITKSQMKNENGELKYDGLMANATPKLDDDGMVILGDNGMPEMDVERRFPIIFYKPVHYDADGNKLTDEEWDELTSEEKQEGKTWFIQESYLVYNLDQTNFATLYPDDYAEKTKTPEHDYKEGVRDDVLEHMILFDGWRCPIRFGGRESCYLINKDEIHLPERKNFLGDAQFYGTALHEMAHSTAKAVNREVTGAFGTEDYAMEEFVAELSSACVCSMLGIGKLLDENTIAYVESWRRALRTDKDFVPAVIDQVQKAVNYILRKYDEVANGNESPKLLTVA